MGIFTRWQSLASEAERYSANQPSAALATPFSTVSHLSPAIAAADIFDLQMKSVTRAEAMSIPAVSRARDLIAVILARQPLVTFRKGVALPDEDQPRFLSHSIYFPPRLRMLWTLDDIIFNGWSLWVLDRGTPDSSGRRQILDALRVAPDRWRMEDGLVIVRGPDNRDSVMDPGDYILFPGLNEGLLSMGARTIRGARRLEEQWSARIENPIPVTEIRYAGDDDPTPEEMKAIRDDFITARNDTNGTVMVTPKGFEVHALGDNAVDLFVEGRNAVAVDVARFFNVPASMLDASQVNAQGVTYENTGVARGGYYDLSLRSWALPIEEALSQDDVLPLGQYVQFNLAALTEPDTGVGPTLED